MSGRVPEPAFVQLFLPVLTAFAAFFLVECVIAARAYWRARRTGSAGLSKSARRFWSLATVLSYFGLAVYASVVVAHHRFVDLKQVREYEAQHAGDRSAREELLRRVKTEMYVGGVALAALTLAGFIWRGVVHEDGWVEPEKLGMTPSETGGRSATRPT